MKNIHFVKYCVLAPFLIVMTLPISAQQVLQNGKTFYLSNTIIVKLNDGITSAQLNKLLAKFSVNKTKEIYPSKGVMDKTTGTDILTGIYHVNYNTMEDPTDFAAKIAKQPGVLWAEPKFLRTVCYSPADSLFLFGKQDNLLQIDATHAWDITTGNKKIIIGIIDTGVDWGNPDLAANIFMENGSIIPGSDLGGENGSPDDDPSEDINTEGYTHGTLVAGIAGAVTNNKIGVASIGFNCSILPVKVTRKDFQEANGRPFIFYGFEGIKWAVDHGATVINCSWGGNSYSSYEQSIIDYALAKGAVVVAAQGNNSSTDNFYPANYHGVLSVGWLDTGIGVRKVNLYANYGEYVKVFAPGTNIYSILQRPTQSSQAIYKTASGSSLSAPLVSGLAGLVWAKFPFYTPMQVEERIRATSNYIDDFNGSSLKYLLGHGLINAFRAVDSSIKATSVRADNISFVDLDNSNNFFKSGEDVLIRMNFTNYLAKVDNVTITLTTTDKYITVENGIFNTGPMDTLKTITNESNEFKIKIGYNIPNHHVIHFLLKYSNGTDYNDFQWTQMEINTDYMMHSNTLTFRLDQNYPNPFNSKTIIGYRLTLDCRVTIKVYDILGREITTLVNERKPIGIYEVEFDAKGLASGIYFYRMQAGSFIETKKFILMK